MGRSVMYLNNAYDVWYLDSDSLDYDFEFEYDWDNFEADLCECIKDKYGSFEYADKWDNRETKVILENNLCEIGISEYCGLISVSIQFSDNDYNYHQRGLAENYMDKIREGMTSIIKGFGQTYSKLGSFSNGEGVYELN